MKKILLLALCTLFSLVVLAQNNPHATATLQHNGRATYYYDITALKEALDASVEGDTIWLSGGSFNADTIRHNISIYGVGYRNMSSASTWVRGEMYIRVPSSEISNHLYIEGIGFYNNVRQDSVLHDPQIVRCYFGDNYVINTEQAYFNGAFVQCRINQYNCWDHLTSRGANATFVNCIINSLATSEGSTEVFRNCVIRFDGCTASDRDHHWNCDLYGYAWAMARLHNMSFQNCILFCTDHRSDLSASAQAIHCVAINEGSDFFTNAHGYGNNVIEGSSVESFAQIFRTWTGGWNDAEDYRLAEAARQYYLGTDGTEVGIYGGIGFTAAPSYPHITRLRTGTKVNPNGTLDVHISVNEGR